MEEKNALTRVHVTIDVVDFTSGKSDRIELSHMLLDDAHNLVDLLIKYRNQVDDYKHIRISID